MKRKIDGLKVAKGAALLRLSAAQRLARMRATPADHSEMLKAQAEYDRITAELRKLGA